MKPDKRKIVLIGTGLVGMSFAYALLNQNACDELALVDIDEQKAQGEAMDLNHGLAFSGSHMRIYAAGYECCEDATIVAVCAGVNQKPGESRIDLLRRNREVFRTVIEPVMASGFSGIFLIATNPVDIMTRITQKLSGLPPRRVLGTGTTLDSARLRYLLGNYFSVDPRNIHAYVMGEHGDSEFVPWSQAMLATKPVISILQAHGEFSFQRLQQMEEEVRSAAAKIIAAKKATYYGIGMAMVRIVRAIFGDEHSILTVSSLLAGDYGQEEVYAGAPCVVGDGGVLRVITLPLSPDERDKMDASCRFLRETFQNLG